MTSLEKRLAEDVTLLEAIIKETWHILRDACEADKHGPVLAWLPEQARRTVAKLQADSVSDDGGA